MASYRFKPNKHSPTTAIRFFKIILSKTLEEGSLKIPNNFTRKYGGGLQNPVYLNAPDGTEWRVHWTKHDCGIFFEKGWKEFATYYSLDHGHLVMFEYKETSHFEVYIFGMSGLEIDYPDDTVEILNEPPPCKGQKRRLKSPLSSPSTSKKLRTAIRTSSPNPEGSQSEEIKLETPSANQDLHGKNNIRKQDSKSLVSPFSTASDALKEAKKFKSKNPSFLVKIVASHVRGLYTPHFSIVFFRKHFKKSKQNVKLRFGRMLCPARLIYYPYKGNAVISAGWPHFAKASELQAGDVCIFELINREVPVLDVHIFRGLEIDSPDDTAEILNEPPPCKGQKRRLKSPLLSPCTSKKLRTVKRTSPNPEGGQFEETKLEMPVVASVNQDLHGKKNRRKLDSESLVSPFPLTSQALKEANEFNSKNPFFIVTIERNNLPGRPHSPVNISIVFFRKYFKQNTQNVKMRFERKLWPAKFICYPIRSQAIISAGWTNFVKASELQAGDVCIFELVNRKDPVLDVHIFRGHIEAIH